MQEIISNLKEVWDLPFARETLLVCATALLTHILDMRKYKKERHTKYQDQIGEKIAIALNAVREIALSTKTTEMYERSIDESKADNANADHEGVFYPAFMTDKETFMKMFRAVNEARGTHEMYLDLLSAAYLYVFERYLMNIMLLVNRYNYQNSLHLLGMILIIDVQRWEKAFDMHLVKRINHPHYRLFSRHGWLWKKAKRYVEKKFLLNTELDKMMRINAEMKEDEDHA